MLDIMQNQEVIYIMTESNNTKLLKCPWCHNSLSIIRSGKTGMHYANCGSCNAHFRNIPLALMGMSDNSTAAAGTDNAQVFPGRDNVKLQTDKKPDRDNRLKGIPPVLWRFLDDKADNAGKQ